MTSCYTCGQDACSCGVIQVVPQQPIVISIQSTTPSSTTPAPIVVGPGIGGAVGAQGTQGPQGVQGVQGLQGTQGTAIQGTQGTKGSQGTQGLQGTQGTQGYVGTQGIQGAQGPQGVQGVQGVQGPQGTQGIQGSFGVQGTTGTSGVSSSYFEYKVDATSQTNSQPSSGYFRYNNSTQTSATALYVNHLTTLNVDIDTFLGLLKVNDNVLIQDASNSNNYQQFKVSGAINPGNNDYVQIPVTYVASAGTGAGTGFANNLAVILVTTAVGIQGVQGLQGSQGIQGAQGVQGTQGFYGTQGTQGTQGVQGIQGIQGVEVTHYFYGTTAPSSPHIGDRWVNADYGIEFTYIYDGVSYNWVETIASGFVGPQGASPQNFDGGAPDSVYGGISIIDCGGVV